MSTVTNLPLGGLVPATPEGGDSAKRQQIALAAREFEAMFLLQMLKQMRQSMLSEEPDGAGLGAATMTDTVDSELARHLSGQPGGLYDVISRAFNAAGTEPPTAASAPRVVAPSVTLAPAAAAPSAVAPSSAAPSSAARPARIAAPITPDAGSASLESTAGTGLQMPEGRISSKFGWRSDPFTGANKFHKGVDIAAAYGEEVSAAAPGRVVFAGVQGAYGRTVVVEHQGGLQTRYAHLSQLDVAQGDVIAQGSAIGRVGKSGRATGAHLHFEVLEEGRPVNPVRATELSRGLKVPAGGADYPTGIARTGVPTGVDDEN